MVSDFFWLAGRDPLAAASEDLIRTYAPDWTGYRWTGDAPLRPDAQAVDTVDYEERIPFTRESWRGRVRTCRAIGPSLAPDQVRRFDEEHRRLLETTAPERFEILHRIRADFYRPA